LRIEVLPTDRFVDLIDRVTEEYCRAYDHADYSYLEARETRPEFTRNTSFNWIPQGSDTRTSLVSGTEELLGPSPVSFTHPMLRRLERDTEPFIVLSDTADEIVGNLYYSLSLCSAESMGRFVRKFVAVLERALLNPERRVVEMILF
jgi:hypothetical protein